MQQFGCHCGGTTDRVCTTSSSPQHAALFFFFKYVFCFYFGSGDGTVDRAWLGWLAGSAIKIS